MSRRGEGPLKALLGKLMRSLFPHLSGRNHFGWKGEWKGEGRLPENGEREKKLLPWKASFSSAAIRDE